MVSREGQWDAPQGVDDPGNPRSTLFPAFDSLRDLSRWWSSPPPERPWLDHYPRGVPAELAYPHRQLGWLLEQAAERYPGRTACRYYHERLTWSEIHEQARRLAATFVQEGLQPGERVGILLPNLPETIVSLYATWMAGGVVVSLSPLMVAEEIGGLIQATGCRFVVTLDVLSPLVCHAFGPPPELVVLSTLSGRLSRLEQLGYAWVRLQRIGIGAACPQTRVLDYAETVAKRTERALDSIPEDDRLPAFILPTGGTTGKPKAVTLTHRNLLSQAWQLAHWSRGHHGEETILAVLPFFHSYGLSTSVMMGTAIGATLVLHHRFRPASAVRLIDTCRPTMFLAVPAMLSAMNAEIQRNRSHDLSSLRAVISGGSALPASVADQFHEQTGAVIVEGYGLSEASPVTHAGPLDGGAIPGTIGLPLPDTDARIVDPSTRQIELPPGEVGELLVRGPQVMPGYWNDPAETSRVLHDGWLSTGDLASCNEDGYFRIVDRIKDLIITSGFNVYPGDVEEVLRGFPGVTDVAVVGVPDEQRGEVVKAILVVESEKSFRKSEFDDFVRQKLAAHKRPRIVETREDDLPRNFLGKVLRRELRGDGEAAEAATGQTAVAEGAGTET